jgi:hypothetical protein
VDAYHFHLPKKPQNNPLTIHNLKHKTKEEVVPQKHPQLKTNKQQNKFKLEHGGIIH